MVDQMKDNDTELSHLRVCWFGSARYSHPLNDTQARKWAALTQLGAELRVVGFSESTWPKQFFQAAHFYLLPQSRFSPFRHLTLLILGTLTLLWLRIRHGCNVFIAQSPYEGWVCTFVTLICKLFGKRTVNIIESHNDFKTALFLQRNVFGAKMYQTLMRHAFQFSIKRADLLRPVSESTQSQLAELAPHTPQIRFVAWTDAVVFLRNRENRQPDQKIIFAGVLIKRKGVHVLLDAFAKCHQRFPQSSLWIIGPPINMEYARNLRQQAHRLGLVEQVHFLGEISQKELGDHFASACCSVLPSTSEGLPRVIIESQLTGTPVIATAVSGNPEMVRDGETGFLVPPGDPEALAGALVKMLSMDEIAWQKMSDNSRNIAKQTFSTEAYLSGYRKLLTLAQDLLN